MILFKSAEVMLMVDVMSSVVARCGARAECSAADAAVGAGLPARRSRHRDGSASVGRLPAGAHAAQRQRGGVVRRAERPATARGGGRASALVSRRSGYVSQHKILLSVHTAVGTLLGLLLVSLFHFAILFFRCDLSLC